MAAATKSPMKRQNLRHILLGKVHTAAKDAGLDSGTPEYESWLAGLSGGKTSCQQLDLGELSAICDQLAGKKRPAHWQADWDDPPEASGHIQGSMIPTTKQWRYLGNLGRRLGWSGLKDKRMLAHIQRTAKVDALGDCDRDMVSKCINGLERRVAQITQKAESFVAGLDLSGATHTRKPHGKS